ncbi:MAG: hypothetical protein Q9159_002540 [Coniocarpon cinnabarinum]
MGSAFEDNSEAHLQFVRNLFSPQAVKAAIENPKEGVHLNEQLFTTNRQEGMRRFTREEGHLFEHDPRTMEWLKSCDIRKFNDHFIRPAAAWFIRGNSQKITEDCDGQPTDVFCIFVPSSDQWRFHVFHRHHGVPSGFAKMLPFKMFKHSEFSMPHSLLVTAAAQQLTAELGEGSDANAHLDVRADPNVVLQEPQQPRHRRIMPRAGQPSSSRGAVG